MTLEELAADCELYAKVISGITVVDDETGQNERREPRETLLKAAAALRLAAEGADRLKYRIDGTQRWQS